MFGHIINVVNEAISKRLNPTSAYKYNLIGRALIESGSVFPAKFKFVSVHNSDEKTILMVKPFAKEVPNITVVIGSYRLDTDTCMLFPNLDCQKALEIAESNTDKSKVIPGHTAKYALDFKHRAISHPTDCADHVDIEMVLWCIRNYGEVSVKLPAVEIVSHG